MNKTRLYRLFFFFVVLNGVASAQSILPYSTRTRDYSGWDTKLRGDIGTIGMGGATVALPTSVSASEANPAGYAMMTSVLSAQINRNSIFDRTTQSSDSISEYQWGLGVCPSPWGFAVAYYSPKSEFGKYTSTLTGNPHETEVSVRQIRLVAARAFFDNALAVGLSIGVNQGIRKIAGYSYNGAEWAIVGGILYRLPEHLVLGASYSPGFTIDPTDDPDQNIIPGFNRSIVSPDRFAIGVGWIPNRFFKVGAGLYVLGKTKNTALLFDQTKLVGENTTWEPRLGGSYVFSEFKHFRAEFVAGTYIESPRITGETNRIHATVGLDTTSWFVNLGIGLDRARDYSNFMVFVGIDIIRSMRLLDLIPKDPVPAYQGFFPPALEVIPDGLPDGLTQGDPDAPAAQNLGDVKKIVQDIPKRARKKFGIGEPKQKPVGRVKKTTKAGIRHKTQKE